LPAIIEGWWSGERRRGTDWSTSMSMMRHRGARTAAFRLIWYFRPSILDTTSQIEGTCLGIARATPS
jgi:hypothetical protein